MANILAVAPAGVRLTPSQVAVHPLVTLLFSSDAPLSPLSRSPRHKTGYEDLVEMLRTRQAVLLLPVAAAIKNVAIGSKEFLETHVAIKNITNAAQFLSINGTRSRRHGSDLQVLAGPPTTNELEQFLGTSNDPKSLYDTFEFIAASTSPPFATSHIHDEDLVEVTATGDLVHMVLLSEPLYYPQCPWGLEAEVERQAKAGRQGSWTGFQQMADYVLGTTPNNWDSVMSPPKHTSSVTSASAPTASLIEGPASAGPTSADAATARSDIEFRKVTPVPAAMGTATATGNASDAATTGVNSVTAPMMRSISALTQQLSLAASASAPLLGLVPPAVHAPAVDVVTTAPAVSNNGSSSNSTIMDETQRVADAKRAQKQFLERLTDPRASSIVRVIRTFVDTFEKENLGPDDKGEQFQAFLREMAHSIRTNVVWANADDSVLEKSLESLERYVTVKIYDSVFSPPDDRAHDQLLAKRIACLSFVQLRHLDVHLQLNEHLVAIACNALKQLSTMKAPADKMAQTMNCCKILMRALSIADNKLAGADAFLPVLIHVILQASPPQLYSNMRFVQRYRDSSKLSTSEAAYYFTNLFSAVSFLETVEAPQLSIDPDEFSRLYHAAELNYTSEHYHENESLSAIVSSSSSTTLEPPSPFADSRNPSLPPSRTQTPGMPSLLLPPLHLTYEASQPSDLKDSDLAPLLAEYKEMARLLRSHKLVHPS